MKLKLKTTASALLLLALLATAAIGQRTWVIVDTDAAPDDLRALCLLLAMDEVRVLGITVCDGGCAPDTGLRKVRGLLRALGRAGIPTAAGQARPGEPPPWRSFCESVPWGDEAGTEGGTGPEAVELMRELLVSSRRPATVLCLGPLTNLAAAVRRHPGLVARIERVLWYNEAVEPPSGSNYDYDAASADLILAAELHLDVIGNPGADAAPFDEELLRRIERLGSPGAQIISAAHNSPAALERVLNGHFRLWDDLVPIYLRFPDLFAMEPLEGRPHQRASRDFDVVAVCNAMLDLLAPHEHSGPVVFAGFPVAPELFQDDLRPFIEEIVERHGAQEWRLCALTSEIHCHLGIYSIVGAKMGLRAREIFGVGPDELSVVSFAGAAPPLSCLNDGLQVSTGATLGHGTISIAADPSARPEAEFTSEGRTIRLRLKPELWRRIRDDIARGIEEHGPLTHEYFHFVRDLAIRYWLEWDRSEIFDVEEDSTGSR